MDKKSISDKKSEAAKGGIKIKQSTKRSKAIFCCKLVAVAAVSAFFGTMSAAYYIHNAYERKGTGQTILKIIDGNNDTIKQSSISKVSGSIVSISDNKDGFKARKSCNTTGVVLRENGYIVTSYNDIVKMDKYVVKIPSLGIKSTFDAKLIGYDILTDIAVLKIDKNNLSVIEFGNSNTLKEGDKVITIGNCIGDDYVGFVTTGIVNSLNNYIEIPAEKDADKMKYKVIETSALINNEISGGVLIDANGEIVGFNSAYIGQKYSKAPLNYVIAINEIKSVVDSIINYGRVKRTTLGFDGVDLPTSSDGSPVGVYVQNITANATAAKAGIKPTDIIIEFDNSKVTCLEDIMKLIKDHKTGDKIKCRILRDGKKKEVELVLQESK